MHRRVVPVDLASTDDVFSGSCRFRCKRGFPRFPCAYRLHIPVRFSAVLNDHRTLLAVVNEHYLFPPCSERSYCSVILVVSSVQDVIACVPSLNQFA